MRRLMLDGSTPTRPAREMWCLVALGLAFLLQVFVLFHPQLAYFTHFTLAVPDPFTDVPHFRRGALVLLFACGGAVLMAGALKLRALVARPRLAVCGVYLFGVALHVALLASLAGSPLAMERRALTSAHGEYLTAAVAIDDLGATLRNYEPFVRSHVFLAAKGPSVLVLFRGLNAVANTAPLDRWLDKAAPNILVLRWWLGERGDVLTVPQMEQLRRLLALILVLFPLVTLLPVFLIAWVGRTFVDDTFGLLAAQLYTLVPAVAMLVAHLDYVLFPLCVMGVVAPFVIGAHTEKSGLVAVSAVVFVLYFTLTLAAISVLPLLAACLGFIAIRRLRGSDTLRSIVLDVARPAIAFAIPAVLVLLLVAVALPFHPVERYSVARELQRTWTSTDYNLFWVATNVLGYVLSFGILQTVLLMLQQGRALRGVLMPGAAAIDDLALAWLCMVVALVAFGQNHGETNRLWAFLSPVACLIVAQYIYERLSPGRLWIPLVAAFGAVILVRSQLSYF
jgi:hypothetical protein